MDINLDFSKSYVGTVIDNKDPKRLGRCRVKVLDVYDNIRESDIPWATPQKDLNGNQFILPEVGKIVSVTFDNQNYYMPIYEYAQHYNINLEKKLNTISNSAYESMRSLMFDAKTQIYSNDDEGLMIDYKFNQINIKNNSVDIKLKDNFGKVSIGTNNATQEAILGTNFLAWFDEFVDNLLGLSGGPYLGNLGAPVIPNPELINVLLKYKALKDPKFLSNNVFFNDNLYVNRVRRKADNQKGDSWRSTVEENDLTEIEPTDFTPSQTSPNWTPDGTLTPPSDGTPATILSDEEIDNQPPSKDINPDVNLLLEIMSEKGYVIYDKPYQINTIGVRYQYPGQEYSNKYKDRLYALYKDENNNWITKYWFISTIPGRNSSWRSGSPLLKKLDVVKKRGGLGILKPAQYIDVYKMGFHPRNSKKKEARAMVTDGRSKQLAFRDQNYNSDKITFSNEDLNNKKGGSNFAMYIHKAYTLSNLKSNAVNNWSEGCQVFGDANSLNEYFDLCEIHKQRHGNKFSYTLITSRDLENMEIKLKQKKRDEETS